MCKMHCGYRDYLTFSLAVVMENDRELVKMLDQCIESAKKDAEFDKVDFSNHHLEVYCTYIAGKAGDKLKEIMRNKADAKQGNDQMLNSVLSAAINQIDYTGIMSMHMRK